MTGNGGRADNFAVRIQREIDLYFALNLGETSNGRVSRQSSRDQGRLWKCLSKGNPSKSTDYDDNGG
jgi:hypothetical protein